MAGFFGLFDYSKPGPGVQKNGPKKKAFVIFFEIYFRKFWKLITANLLFVLVTLPVVTLGLSNAGLTYIARNFAREKHAFIAGDFFDTIKKNWKQALPVGIINLLASAVILFSVYFYYSSTKGLFGSIMLGLSLMVALIFQFMQYYMYTMIITFRLKLRQIYKNSLIFAFAGLGRNLLITLLLALFYALGVLILLANLPIGIIVCTLAYLFLFPAFRMFLIEFATFPIIKKHMIDPYYRDHPGEDLEAKRALNLLDEEEDTDGDERVFEDTLPQEEEPADDGKGKKGKPSFPRQLSQDELNRLNRRHSARDDEDDDTI